MQTEPALRFWLEALASEGGIVATTEEPALVLIPDRWQDLFDLPDEATVTADPEVSREDGAILVTAGEPSVARVAELVLGDGDAGWSHLAWPTLLPPSQEAFQTLVRDRVPIDGASVEVDGQPAPVYVPVIRVGVIVRYAISLDDRFDEKEEISVDARCGQALPTTFSRELDRAAVRPGVGRDHRTLPCDIRAAVQAAHGQLNQRARARREWLVGCVAAARHLELKRAEAHYDAALGAMAARSAASPASSQSLYAAQANAIRAERSRRLLEIGQHPPASHEVRPYRLHVVGVPALRVPVVIRRGSQSFSFSLDWYLPFSAFGPVSCPHCQSNEALVVNQNRLGCRRCLVSEPARSEPAGAPLAAVAPASPVQPAPSEPSRNGHAVPVPATPRPAPASYMAPVPTPSGLAIEFWDSVAQGHLWPRRSTVASSPLEVLTRLLGAEGPLRAVGMPRRPTRITNATSELTPVDRVTSGLLGRNGTSLPYTLRWRLVDGRPMVSEVLPFASFTAASGSPLPSLVGLDRRAVSSLTEAAPRPRSLGPVEGELWQRVAVEGLPFVVRCLVVWRRLEVRARLAGVDPAVLAAAVALVCAERCAIETTAKAQAEHHGVSDFAVGHVSRQLNSLVKGMAAPLW